jgi:hypothetical protein
MHPLPEIVQYLPRLSPSELGAREKHLATVGNKAAFLRAARGTMSEAEGIRFQKLIDYSCERIDA